MIVAIFVPPLLTGAADVATAISDVAQEGVDCTLATVFITGDGAPPTTGDGRSAKLGAGSVQVPDYEFPEDAARAVALAARHGVWRARPEGSVRRFDDCRSDEAAAIISEHLAGGAAEWLAPEQVAALLHCYGLPLAPTGGVPNVSGALAAAAEPTASSGVELIVGVVHDPSFGPVLACAARDTTGELIKDVAVRITPLTDVDAHDMIRSLKTFPLLDGYRGAVPCDLEAIEDVLERVGAMVEAHPEIAELDCCPLIAGPEGATIVDARIRLAASDPPAPVPSLRA